MTNQPPPELFAERPVHSDFGRVRSYRLRRIVTCCVVVALLGGGVYSIYLWQRGPREIPTIKAELPLKQKPQQPGGIDIPNQDVLAYQQIDNSGGNQPPVEHLLPPPEAPQAANAAPPPAVAPPADSAPPSIETLAAPPAPPPMVTTVSPQKTTGSPPAPAIAEVPPTASAPAAPAPETPQPAAAAAPEAPQAAATAPPADLQPPAAVPSPSPSPPVQVREKEHASRPAASSTSGRKGFRIQLASFPDKETAVTEMARMEKRYAAHLGPARLHLAKADLGARGIYYRVQSNPITDIEARDICAALKNLKAGCIVVKP